MRYAQALFLCLTTVLLIGCTNPYVDGFTGQGAMPMPKDAPVAVIGANRADPLQMRRFEQAMADANTNQRMLGSSTIISASLLRDDVAAEAGRKLGASLVLYNFKYLNSTVERDTQTYRRHTKADDTYYTERRSYDSTRHWYEYRAYFFESGATQGEVNPSSDPDALN